MPPSELDRIQIRGYKSIAECDVDLDRLNLLIGPNGAGKSNFISALGLLGSVVNRRLQNTVARAGGASTLLHRGPKITDTIQLHAYFGANQYEVNLEAAAGDHLFVGEEICYFLGTGYKTPFADQIGSNIRESNLRNTAQAAPGKVADHCLNSMSSWQVFHFHDTSPRAAVKQKQRVDDNAQLRSDAANLAPFLYRLFQSDHEAYERIRDAVRLVAPFFDDFRLDADRRNRDSIQLEWSHVDSDQYLNAHSLSDGTLRFICLATLLLQPMPPPVIIVDEPELGLHPFAINQLAAMFRSVAIDHQVIASTQSVTLLNQTEPENLIITEQHDGASTFERLDLDSVSEWLDGYYLGELWEKNVLGGRPY